MALYNLSNPLQAESFKARAARLLQKKVIVELSERKPQRSHRQNAYLHVALSYFGAQTGYTMAEVKEWYFKRECNAELFVRVITDSITGKQRERLRSSAELTVDEMTTAIERFRVWASKEAGIYIPAPDEHAMIMEMEVEVSRAKIYL